MGLRHTQNSSGTLGSTPGPICVTVFDNCGTMPVTVSDINATVIMQVSTDLSAALAAPGQVSTNSWRF